MKIYIFLVVGHIALTQASEIPQTEGATLTNCTKPDKATIQKKVTAAMEKTVENLFRDASFFRKKRFVSAQSDAQKYTDNHGSEMYAGSVVPIELEREHQRDEGKKSSTDLISKRSSLYQLVTSFDNIAYANAIHKKDKHTDSNVQKAISKGGDFAYAGTSTTLWRSKRFCVPLSYDDGVKKMVKQVVDQAFKTIEF
ncbi:uncharacterized protein LOC110847832 isoform X2 [Folsomia candida]|uniref:uncharacterized protein LOC110847832 isoform X2 n=1 Tax=Folsomia candida TaxID=158441 RepID=UPI0016054585|nr:uncharacterized protein LOC110847832 isoform X2 [Folsomia candida]